MIKILFIHHATGWGGAPINMINIINSLDKKKYHVKVLLIKDSVVSEKLREFDIEYALAKSFFYKKVYEYYSYSEGGYIKWFHIYSLFVKTISWLLSRYYFAAKELKNHECEIIHLNSSVLTDWLSPSSKKGKVIYHIQEPLTRGIFGLRYTFFRYQVNKYADQIIAISEDNATRINLPEKTTIIYNYAEKPNYLPTKSSFSSKKVLYLGGTDYIKGFFTLVNALDYLDNDVKVYFGGDYTCNRKRSLLKQFIRFIISYGKKKEAAIQKIRTHPNAIVIGLTNSVNDYLDDVCCLVSPFSASHFARTVIEAHLHHKPVIGSDVKGMDETIEHEKTGLIVPKDKPKLLAEAINKLTSDSQFAKKMGEEGYNIAILKFTPKNVIELEILYNILVS